MIAALMVVTYVPSLTVVPEKPRRGNAAELARRVHLAYQEETAVKELTLPDGKVTKVSDCAAIQDPIRREECTGLFIDVTQCRNRAAGKIGSECEVKVIADHVRLSSDGEDEQDDSDWDLDEGEDKGGAGKEASDDDAGEEESGAGTSGAAPKKSGAKDR
jgi:hypothetical protein